MKRRRARPEDQIQRAVFQHIAARGAPSAYFFHIPLGGKRKPIEAAIFKSLGVRAGMPDVCAIHQGRFYGLELKTEVGRLGDAQIATLEQLEHAGAICHVAYGLDQALAWLEERRLLVGRAA